MMVRADSCNDKLDFSIMNIGKGASEYPEASVISFPRLTLKVVENKTTL